MEFEEIKENNGIATIEGDNLLIIAEHIHLPFFQKVKRNHTTGRLYFTFPSKQQVELDKTTNPITIPDPLDSTKTVDVIKMYDYYEERNLMETHLMKDIIDSEEMDVIMPLRVHTFGEKDPRVIHTDHPLYIEFKNTGNVSAKTLKEYKDAVEEFNNKK